jgi:hypothetical protein
MGGRTGPTRCGSPFARPAVTPGGRETGPFEPTRPECVLRKNHLSGGFLARSWTGAGLTESVPAVSGESLVIFLVASWLLITAAVFVPALFPRRTEELSGPVARPDYVEDFVEAISRGDFDAAEQAAASLFDSVRGAVTVKAAGTSLSAP